MSLDALIIMNDPDAVEGLGYSRMSRLGITG